MSRLQASTSVVVLAVLTLAAVAVGALNLREQRRFRLPEDGVVWRDSFGGVVAESLTSDGPAAKAGLRAGDFVVGINGQSVSSAASVAQELFALGTGAPGAPGAEVRYEVVRGGFPAEFQIVLEPQTRPTVRLYLQIAGVFYLALGLFVLWRRARAPAVLHFYLFCLASFVLFVFSYTGRLDTFDWTVYWASVAALLLQPALFVHFCRAYPHSVPGFSGPPRGSRWALAWMYGPAALLGAIQAGVALGALRVAAPLSEIRWWLDRVEIAYFAGMFLIGIGLLASAYSRIRSRAGRKQVGWVLGGAALAGVPFTLGYAVPYLLGATPGAWMNFAALSLVFLPVAFAYAVLRHRLLDVEIVLERGLVYTLATGTLVGAYLGLVALAGDFFRTYFPGAGTVGLVAAVIATGLLFQPLQRAIQARLERYFLRKRYDYRGALLVFGRELSSTTNPDHMIASLLGQLSAHLQVDRAAVFVPAGAATESGPPSFVLRGSVGVDADETFDFGFLGALRSANPAGRDRLVFPDWDASVERELAPSGEAGASFTAWQTAIAGIELHYYFPCRSKNRLIAVLGVGKTTGGEFLSDEDTALLETLAGYLAVALENATLVESLETKAEQYEKLQQFSENILESINVGLLAVDLEDRIEAVNTPLELMWPLPFRESLGKKLGEVLPPDLTAQLVRLREDGDIHNIYRYRALPPGGTGREGRERVFHIAVAPLLSKTCDAIGRLIIVDDVTDRVVLEAQLAQAEKLSSVGLLAAGVAHEVNTPLTVISTQAQMLAKQLPAGERASKILDKIIGQTFRASEIVNSLLNFSRTQGAAYAPLDLNQTLADTLLLLDHALKTARIEVESLLDSSLPPVSGNSGKLQQVFLNLLLNAKDAMPNGGRLRVVTWAEDSTVRIEISDTGAGIPPEDLPRIFDPFFTTKGPGRGTGLGLSVSYGIMQEHAGKIQAESWPGLGTRFRLEFPALKSAVPA